MKVSKNCQILLKILKGSLILSAQELKSGSIQIGKLRLMLSAKSRYKDVTAFMWKYEKCKEFEEEVISALLDRRNKELEKLDETLKNIVAFKEMLQCFEGINDTQWNHKFAKNSCRQLQLKNDRCNMIGDNF